MSQKTLEKGQSIVLLMLVVVGMLAFVALGVDGGTVYSQRRQMQTAADNAVFSAAMAVIENEDYTTAARTQASLNGITHNGTDPNVEVFRPPASGEYAGNNEYVQVRITATSKPVFSQFVFNGKLENTVEAVVRAVSAQVINQGNILFATNKTECSALLFQGSADVFITDGGIASNSDGSAKAKNCVSAEMASANHKLWITNGGVSVHADWDEHPNANVKYDSLHEYVASMPVPEVPVPACDKSTSKSYTGQASISPGWYPSGINKTNGSSLEFQPGLYCFGNKLKITGGLITGTGVMFYMEGGDVWINGNANSTLTAPTNLVDANGTQWAGMLIYMPATNTNIIHITGNSNNTFSGTILAPGTGSPVKCEMQGNSDTAAFKTQVICDTIKIIGGSNANYQYVEGLLFKSAPQMELVK